jgi:hypothetical protein
VGRLRAVAPGPTVAEDPAELTRAEPLELPLLAAGPVQHRDLEVRRGHRAVLGLPLAECLDGDPDGVLQGGAGLVVLLEVLLDLSL